jgi:hypothetical protein
LTRDTGILPVLIARTGRMPVSREKFTGSLARAKVLGHGRDARVTFVQFKLTHDQISRILCARFKLIHYLILRRLIFPRRGQDQGRSTGSIHNARA